MKIMYLRFQIIFIFYIFAMILVSHDCFNHVVKRESGVNPEQARCCKLHQCLWQDSYPLFRMKMGRMFKGEEVRKPARIIIVSKFRGVDDELIGLRSECTRSKAFYSLFSSLF